ncbi:hypothetical protein [Mycobacterium sp. MS1601]|uniref:hypothetical protein n=1 Tax=Mycobacterium sp. MS1601 TaxID=1936029 RepID=UPI0012F914D5|nr:hypothetical protein [Mycobacterium sp. MS1601]
MISINVFDVTPEMLDILLPARPEPAPPVERRRVRRRAPSRPARDPSAPHVEVCLVRGYVRAAPTPRCDSYGIPLARPREYCPRCGIRYTAENPILDPGLGAECRDCSDVGALLNKDGG